MNRLVTVVSALIICFSSIPAFCTDRFDIGYIWHDDIEAVLDYQQQVEELFDSKTAKKLHIVGRESGGYGLIYDLNGDSLSSAKTMVEHSEILRGAGLEECFAVEDTGYYRLFNVGYALGPNLESMKELYRKVYVILGSEVGKDLYIEQTDAENYTLIYRRRGERSATYQVAKRHARLLKKSKIGTTILAEVNNPVVYGESSYLNLLADTTAVVPPKRAVQPAPRVVPAQPSQQGVGTEKIEVVTISPVKRKILTAAGSTAIVVDDEIEHPIESDIETFIKKLRRQGKLSSDEMTGWVAYDLTAERPIVDINAEHVFQAASMIKPFVALAFFHKVKEGSLIYGPKSRHKLERMIQRSDNEATNWVMKMVGGPANCQRILKHYYSDIFKKTIITEYIPAGGKTYKNSAAPADYIRFLHALWDGGVPYHEEIRRLMSLPGRDRLYDGTPIPQGTLVYNKTGSTAHLCGDMGILVPRDRNGKRYPYIVVGVIQRDSRPKNYSNWMLTRGNVIRQVSTLVYEEMKRQYRLL
jgi:beta-lactamase class A